MYQTSSQAKSSRAFTFFCTQTHQLRVAYRQILWMKVPHYKESGRLEARELNVYTLRYALDIHLPSFQKFILIAMAHLGTSDGVCIASYPDLGAFTGQRAMYVRRGVAALVESGLVRILGQEGSRGKIKYQIVMES